MNVLSLFDGMSCGQIALRELGIKVDNYFASEIDKHAIAQTQLNFPDTIQLGDVCGVHAADLPPIDLLIAGSPCQGFSFAGKMLNFNDPRSKLFFEFVRILDEYRAVNPDVKYLLENVRMRREYQYVISDTLGIEPVMINSALVSAQNRVRLYWSNIRTAPFSLFMLRTDIPQPADRNIYLKDILDDDVPEHLYMSDELVANMFAHAQRQKEKGNGFGMRPKGQDDKANSLTVGGGMIQDVIMLQRPHGHNIGGIIEHKAPTLTSSSYEHNNFVGIRKVVQVNPDTESNGKQPYQQNRVYDSNGICPAMCSAHAGNNPIVRHGTIYRRLTIKERSRLQTIPDWYRWACSDTQAAKMLGNGWTVEVIKHILSFL